MNRLALTLGIVVAVSPLAAAGFSENFESYNPAEQIAGKNHWQEAGRGEWFETNATTPADPNFLGTRYADLGNNGKGTETSPAWLTQLIGTTTSGVVDVQFDTKFNAAGTGGLESSNIYLCDSSRVSGYSSALQAAAIAVGTSGLRVHDGGWRVVDNFTLQNDTWYHFGISVNLDAKTWQLAVGTYTGDTLGAPVTVSYGGDDTFAFRDSSASLDDIGMIEFATASDIMNDAGQRGFFVDNIVPEPASMAILSFVSLGLLARRNTR